MNEGQRLLGMTGEVNTDKLLRLEGIDDYSKPLTESWTVCLIEKDGKLLEQPKRLPMPDAEAVELTKPIAKYPIRNPQGCHQ